MICEVLDGAVSFKVQAFSFTKKFGFRALDFGFHPGLWVFLGKGEFLG